jgi:hypothetical protein
LYCPVDATGKHHKECEYDTRPHTSPPAPAPRAKNEFIIVSVECGINLCYGDEEFTLDDDMKRTLLMYFARYDTEMFNHIVCPYCKAEAAKAEREQVLDAVIAWKRKHGYWFTIDAISGEKRYHFEPDAFEEFVKSLRAQQGGVSE